MVNLAKLFETQQVLDERIMEQHPELRGQNNLDWKILALQVELGECANEWRGFKKWSNDQESRTSVRCPRCSGEGTYAAHYIGGYNQVDCNFCNATGSVRNPLLEEYVDCLGFLLTIGNEQGFCEYSLDKMKIQKSDEPVLIQFSEMFLSVSDFYVNDKSLRVYANLLRVFISLGMSLGFNWEQVEQAYFEKECNKSRTPSKRLLGCDPHC